MKYFYLFDSNVLSSENYKEYRLPQNKDKRIRIFFAGLIGTRFVHKSFKSKIKIFEINYMMFLRLFLILQLVNYLVQTLREQFHLFFAFSSFQSHETEYYKCKFKHNALQNFFFCAQEVKSVKQGFSRMFIPSFENSFVSALFFAFSIYIDDT